MQKPLSPFWAVKSQIQAGRRGKGKFKELDENAKGGVRVSFSQKEAITNAQEMLGKTTVIKQKSRAGKQVNRLYFEDGTGIEHEIYSRSSSIAKPANSRHK